MVDSGFKIATDILKQREIIERFYLQRRRCFSIEVFELSIADDEFPPWENLEENLGVVLHLLVSPAAAAAAHAQSEKHDSQTTQTDLQKSSHFKIEISRTIDQKQLHRGNFFRSTLIGTRRGRTVFRSGGSEIRNPRPGIVAAPVDSS